MLRVDHMGPCVCREIFSTRKDQEGEGSSPGFENPDEREVTRGEAVAASTANEACLATRAERGPRR